MIYLKQYFPAFILLGVVFSLVSCSQPGKNAAGSEYVPDMAHPVTYEANVYEAYPRFTWKESVMTRKELSLHHNPVAGTIPRGYTGIKYSGAKMLKTLTGQTKKNAVSVPINGHVPYHYANTPEGRARAIEEIQRNPFPITDKALATGKKLFNLYCAICHGEKGNGEGYLVREDGGKYPAMPRNFLGSTEQKYSNGVFYNAIMHGYNVMGSFADRLSYEERWDVIHYIRSLQAKASGKTYNAKENTFNRVAGKPVAVHQSYTDYIGAEKETSK